MSYAVRPVEDSDNKTIFYTDKEYDPKARIIPGGVIYQGGVTLRKGSHLPLIEYK